MRFDSRPVDVLEGFLRKEQYAIALALMENNQPVLGILGCPNLPLDLKNPSEKRGCILVRLLYLPSNP
jgi:3'-phosphoadenosine 5'-phosphosulfate (PAPS) 3'-phosphatase